MRVLVCGGRKYNDEQTLWNELDALHLRSHIEVIIEGEALGADTLARLWAEDKGVPVLKFPADWKKHGRAAGPIRNKQMLAEGKPNLVLAFPVGNLSELKGTLNMVTQARNAGVLVRVVGTINE